MTFLLNGEKEHEISQAFAKAEILWVRFKKEQDDEWATEGMLFNWKCMGLFGSILLIFTKISPAWPSFFIPWWRGLWHQQRFFCGECTLKRAGSLQLTRKALTKYASCFLFPSLHDNFLRMFRLQEVLIRETDVFQRGHWVWAVKSLLSGFKTRSTTCWSCVLGQLIRSAWLSFTSKTKAYSAKQLEN